MNAGKERPRQPGRRLDHQSWRGRCTLPTPCSSHDQNKNWDTHHPTPSDSRPLHTQDHNCTCLQCCTRRDSSIYRAVIRRTRQQDSLQQRWCQRPPRRPVHATAALWISKGPQKVVHERRTKEFGLVTEAVSLCGLVWSDGAAAQPTYDRPRKRQWPPSPSCSLLCGPARSRMQQMTAVLTAGHWERPATSSAQVASARRHQM
jgi:hypothetical protein